MNVSKKDWDALVRLFREEERTLRDSFGTPGCKAKTWEAEYKKMLPGDWKIHNAARKAVERNSKKRKR